MSVPLLKGLSEEMVVLLSPKKASRLPFPMKGIVRFVNSRGKTLGLLLDGDALKELGEDIEAANPGFLLALERSRASGRISGEEVKRKAGLK